MKNKFLKKKYILPTVPPAFQATVLKGLLILD